MVLSAIFHTFNSHSQEASEFCLMLDLGGISCSITASYISGNRFICKWCKITKLICPFSGIYYAFWCHPGLQYFYMLTVLGFILCGLIFRNTFNKDENLIPRYFALHLFQVDHAVDCNWSISQADLFHHLCHLRLCAHHPLGLAQWNWKRRGRSQILKFTPSYPPHSDSSLPTPGVDNVSPCWPCLRLLHCQIPWGRLAWKVHNPILYKTKNINWSYLKAVDLFIIYYRLLLRFDILGSSHQWWHIFIFLCLAYCKLLP